MQARDGGPERVAEDRGWNGFGSWCRYRSMCQNAITAIEVQADGKLLIAGAGSDESNNLQLMLGRLNTDGFREPIPAATGRESVTTPVIGSGFEGAECAQLLARLTLGAQARIDFLRN